MKKLLRFVLFGLLALFVTAAIAVFLIMKFVLAPTPGDWAERVKFGPLAFDVDVPTAVRLATSPWAAPILNGRSFETAHGPIHLDWNDGSNTLGVDCAPCSVPVAALGTDPIRVDKLRVTVRRDAGSLNGAIEATPPAAAGAATEALRANWDGRLSQKALAINISAADAPIARWYAVLAPTLPELQRARIGGTLGFSALAQMPAGTYSVRPRIAQFTVEGLGTDALLNARTSCGPSSRLSSDSWLARAVIAAEDQRFFTHPGYDVAELGASFDVNAKAGQVERGGSTITQQVARLVVTGGERNAQRKLREMLYAVEMEQTLGKARILQLYLDNAPWGPDICGAETASRRYFKRGARDLQPAQAVWLAAMLNNPTAALEKWQQDGNIDAQRAKWVAEGVHGISRNQRDSLLRSVAGAKFAPP